MKTLSATRHWLAPLHLSGLDEGELGSARLRFWGGLAVLVAYLVAHLGTQLPLAHALTGILVFTSFGFLSAVAVSAGVLNAFWRKALFIGLDCTIFSWGFAYSEGMLAPIFWMPIFMAIGTGMRFGSGWATYSACLGGSLSTLAMLNSPFWHLIPGVGLGVALGMTLLPIYAVSLSNRLNTRRREAEERAMALEQASLCDPLTGLSNRAGYARALRATLANAQDGRSGAAVFYIDLDGFKQVNDSAGHDSGDVVLRQSALCMQAVLRATDHCARLGGDEFALIAPGVERANDAQLIGNKVLTALAALRVPGHDHLRISASIGVCLVPRFTQAQVAEVSRKADLLMLKVKQTGKGACEVTHMHVETQAQAA